MTTYRQRKLESLPPPYDLANPPAGVRLNVAFVAMRLKVTNSDMAAVTGISRTAVFNATENNWPARADKAAIQAALHQLLAERGATPDELATLWHAHSTRPELGHQRAPYQPDRPTAPQQPPEEPDMLLPKQTLTPEARRAFKLFTNPFSGDVTDDAQMFNGDDFAYVREALWQCGQTGGFVALVGESGAGKTTVLADLKARLERDDRSLILIAPSVVGMECNDTKGKALKSDDIIHAIITTLDPAATIPRSPSARTTRAKNLLLSSDKAGAKHLLVIEEAHSMPEATLTHLKRLHEIRDGRRTLLGILLVAQPELKATLAKGLYTGRLREVAQRCEIVELLPLSTDLKGYLQTRAAAANVDLAKLMDDEAIAALAARLTRKHPNDPKRMVSMCYPLAVNNMVTKAMNEAARLGWDKVTADVFRAI